MRHGRNRVSDLAIPLEGIFHAGQSLFSQFWNLLYLHKIGVTMPPIGPIIEVSRQRRR